MAIDQSRDPQKGAEVRRRANSYEFRGVSGCGRVGSRRGSYRGGEPSWGGSYWGRGGTAGGQTEP